MKALAVTAALLLFSCSHEPPKKEDVAVVDFEQASEEKSITISESVNTDYGPAPIMSDGHTSAGEKKEENETAKPILALDLFPSLYNSLGFISTFRQLEEENITVDVVSSFGFSAVFAALYAKYESANLVEWKAFELYQLLGEEKPFAEEWRVRLRSFLQEEFGKTKLSQLKKLLIIVRKKDDKLYFDSKSPVVEALLASVDLDSPANPLLAGDYEYLLELKKFGADFVFRVSFLPEKIALKHPNGFVYGVYSKLSGKVSGPYVFKKALKGEVDAFSNLSDSVYQTKKNNRDFARELSARIEKRSGKN